MYRFIKILAVIGTFLLLSVVISTPASGMSFLWQGLDVSITKETLFTSMVTTLS